MGSSNQAE